MKTILDDLKLYTDIYKIDDLEFLKKDKINTNYYALKGFLYLINYINNWDDDSLCIAFEIYKESFFEEVNQDIAALTLYFMYFITMDYKKAALYYAYFFTKSDKYKIVVEKFFSNYLYYGSEKRYDLQIDLFCELFKIIKKDTIKIYSQYISENDTVYTDDLEIIPPILSVIMSIITSFGIVTLLGYTIFPNMIANPLMPLINYAYIFHPLFRYKLSWSKAYPPNYGFVARFIVIHLITGILNALANYGNSLSQQQM
jgi:hypothetical protein